jgi:hypothetical protein
MSQQHIEHPFEDIFDIEPGTTVLDIPDQIQTDLVVAEHYDDKDNEIEQQLQTVYDAALNAFNFQVTAEERGSDPRNSARNLEVANQFLNTALAAVKEKADLKHHKDKSKAPTTQNITNNNLIMDRNDLLAMIQGNNIIEG